MRNLHSASDADMPIVRAYNRPVRPGADYARYRTPPICRAGAINAAKATSTRPVGRKLNVNFRQRPCIATRRRTPLPCNPTAPPTTPRCSPAADERILILDGAMGTMIQRYRLAEADYRGARFADHAHDLKGDNDLLVLTRPDVIRAIHDAYLEAGADIIETNTFNATAIAQADYRLEGRVHEINVAAARHRARMRRRVDRAHAGQAALRRRRARARPTAPRRSRPTSTIPARATSTSTSWSRPTPRRSRRSPRAASTSPGRDRVRHAERQGGAVRASSRASSARAGGLPVIVSGTITDASGRTLSGQTTEAFWNSVRHVRPLAVGLNCALGAALMRPYIEEIARVADTFVSCYPNAGLPNPMAETGYDETPEQTAALIARFARNGFVNIVGGCCGTTPAHIRAIAEAVRRPAAAQARRAAKAARPLPAAPDRRRGRESASRCPGADAPRRPRAAQHRRRLAVRQRRRADQRHRLARVRAS